MEKLVKHDADSEGEQSFLTTSARSFASMVTDADRENESILNGLKFDIAFITNTPLPSLPPLPPQAAANDDVQHELLQLHARLKKQDEIILALTDKVNQTAKITPVLQDTLEDKDEVFEDTMATDEHKKNTQPSRLERLEMKFDQMLNAVAFLQ
jgi:hypothetical protein